MGNIISQLRIEHTIKEEWKILMDTVNNIQINDKNKATKEFRKFEIQEIYLKEYGFNCIISIPFSYSLLDFRKLMPSISIIYKANIIAELSANNSSIYMRCHCYGLPIGDVDDIKFKWYMLFTDNKTRNINGETYTLLNRVNIYHPTLKDENNEKVLIGYRFNIDIPSGLSYEELNTKLVDLNKLFGICSLIYNDDTKELSIEIIKNKLGDNENYKPIPVKPWELYISMTHAYKPIILDFQYSPNLLIGGAPGSGKTVGMMIALLNLVLHNSEKIVNLYIAMLSDKQDLKVFRNIKHCKGYARDLISAKKQLEFLNKEMSRRNRLFDDFNEDGEIVNIYDYNEVAETKLPVLYFCLDEVASFAVNGTELNKAEEKVKKYCNALLWKLAREGRSAGIYTILCTQRGSLTHMSGDIKGMLSNTICFFFPNVASALTILGDGDLAILAVKQKKKREFIATGNDNYFGKTLYLNPKTMVQYLKPLKKPQEKMVLAGETVKITEIETKNEKNKKKCRWENKKK